MGKQRILTTLLHSIGFPLELCKICVPTRLLGNENLPEFPKEYPESGRSILIVCHEACFIRKEYDP